MGHELRRQLSADELDVIGFEGEGTAEIVQYLLDGTESDEVGVAWSKQKGEGRVLEAEHGSSTSCNHCQHTEEHLAQFLKMIAKRHSAIFYSHGD